MEFLKSKCICSAVLIVACASLSFSNEPDDAHDKIDKLSMEIENQVINWRRDIHEHPELPNQEVSTSRLIAKKLKDLKFDEVRTEVAHTGVVGLLKGDNPGPVVALRAEIDAGIGEEEVEVPFSSKVTTTQFGKKVRVVHALDHDAHTAILLGTAQVLANMRSQLSGSVLFIFQPAEGLSLLPAGESGGAELMIEEGVLQKQKPDVIFALNTSDAPTGTIQYRSGFIFASSYKLNITVTGKEAFGAYPWLGRDPLPAAAQIILSLEGMPNYINFIESPVLISIGKIDGGSFYNRTPEIVNIEGMIRILDSSVQDILFKNVEVAVKNIAKSRNLSADVVIKSVIPAVYNDPKLADEMLPSLQRDKLSTGVYSANLTMGSENFGFFSQQIPAFYFFIGSRSENNSGFDEKCLYFGVKSLSSLAFDYLYKHRSR
jgi:amidohydrolase